VVQDWFEDEGKEFEVPFPLLPVAPLHPVENVYAEMARLMNTQHIALRTN
jgi:hypothetical protein